MKTPSLPSHMSHAFGAVPRVDPPRSSFRRPQKHKTTFNAGYLIPYFRDEVLPGDSFSVSSTLVCRLSTPVAPIMDDIYIDTHFFYVPKRILWSNWQRFCGAQDNPGDSTDFLEPQIICPFGGWLEDSIPAYLGNRQRVDNLDISALFTRAYNLIYNEFYRDQDLQPSATVDLGDGPDDPANYVLRRRCKRPDYFTTCRPFVQKGPDVLLPLGESAPVYGDGVNSMQLTDGFEPFSFRYATSTSNTGTAGTALGSTAAADTVTSGNVLNIVSSGTSGVFADLSSATASTVNALRFAFAMQRKRERDARSGTRYNEMLLAHWGVISPDFRLQRPEYLGGGSQRMNFQTVANTNLTGTNNAELGAFGLSVGSRHGFTKSFTEYGLILGLVSVRRDQTYQQGVHRMFSRRSFDDYFLPVFSGLGEQAVLNKEIFAQGTAADDEVFGYNEYGSEYRYGSSMVTGIFNSDYPTPLHFWHIAENYSSLPVLSDAWIQDNPPLDRVLAVSGSVTPHIIMDSFTNVTCARRMPVYGIPGMVDHF